MFREIKFRAKRTDNEKPGVWAYGDLTHTIKIGIDHDTPCIRVGGCDIDEKTIGQYIGLKDKDGKDVYEGDIIDVTFDYRWQVKGVICFENKTQMTCIDFIDGDESYEDLGISKREWLCNMCIHTMRVIGNIYDNSDMLDEELKRKYL